MPRAVMITDAGRELQCSKCLEFWPADEEFFYFRNGIPHSWCKDCYIHDEKVIAKNKASRARHKAKLSAAGEEVAA